VIVQDQHGTILLDNGIPLLLDQNGNHWKITDEGDGIGVELILMGRFAEIAAVPVAAHTFKIKATMLGQQRRSA
jgi:hypothetical protein